MRGSHLLQEVFRWGRVGPGVPITGHEGSADISWLMREVGSPPPAGSTADTECENRVGVCQRATEGVGMVPDNRPSSRGYSTG